MKHKPWRRHWRVIRPALLVMLVVPLINSAEPAVDSPASQIVPLYLHRNRPLAMLTVGDRLPSPVVFDTGTDENIVSKSLVDQLGLRIIGTSPLHDLGSGRSTIVPVAALPDPKLGGIGLTVTRAQVLDRQVPDEVGIFGPNSFGDSFVIIEAGLNRLRIVPRGSGLAPAGPGTPYQQRLPSVPIKIGSRTVMAHIDSGNDEDMILGGDLMKTLPMKAPAKVVGVAVSALGEREVYGGQLNADLRVGTRLFHDPNVTFSPSGGGANIGFPIIRGLIIILDPANRKSWVLDPNEPVSLVSFTGKFGPRTLSMSRGVLMHQRDGRPRYALKYLGSDLFEISATGDYIQFFRRNGQVTHLELISPEGDVAPATRILASSNRE